MATQRIVIYMPFINFPCVVVKEQSRNPGPRLAAPDLRFQAKWLQVVGVTGFEPVTLRLSSACSNQLSYTPAFALGAPAGRPANRGPLPRAQAGGAEETRTPDL